MVNGILMVFIWYFNGIYMGGRADLQRIYNGLVTNLSPCRKHHPLQVQAIRLRLLPARPCDR